MVETHKWLNLKEAEGKKLLASPEELPGAGDGHFNQKTTNIINAAVKTGGTVEEST